MFKRVTFTKKFSVPSLRSGKLRYIEINMVLNDTLNYINGSLDSCAKTAGIPYTSRKKNFDHQKVNITNYHQFRDEILYYLRYDIECLQYVHHWTLELLFNAFNKNPSIENQIPILSAGNFTTPPRWREYQLHGYPNWMTHLNRMMRLPYDITPTTTSASMSVARDYGLNSRAVMTNYYKDLMNETKHGKLLYCII